MSFDNLDSLTAVEVAQLLSVTDRAVRKWSQTKGLPSNSGDGVKTFKWADVLAWHVAQARNQVGTGGTEVVSATPSEEPVRSESYDDALARKTRAEADLKELQLAEKRGQVASIEDVEKAITSANLATRTQIEAIPSRLAVQLVGLKDRNTAHKLLTRETHQLLTNLATMEAIREAATESTDGDED